MNSRFTLWVAGMSTIAMFLPFLCRPTADRNVAPISAGRHGPFGLIPVPVETTGSR
jgi:hypothetical protein